jgi:hypothetical protein
VLHVPPQTKLDLLFGTALEGRAAQEEMDARLEALADIKQVHSPSNREYVQYFEVFSLVYVTCDPNYFSRVFREGWTRAWKRWRTLNRYPWRDRLCCRCFVERDPVLKTATFAVLGLQHGAFL